MLPKGVTRPADKECAAPFQGAHLEKYVAAIYEIMRRASPRSWHGRPARVEPVREKIQVSHGRDGHATKTTRDFFTPYTESQCLNVETRIQS